MEIPGLIDLPSELVCNIFRLTIDQADSRQDLCRLLLVCRQWREYVESSALLWTDIVASEGLTHVRRALEKSRGAMIDINCQLCWKPPMELEEFMDEVGPHIARWRSLMVLLRRATTDLENALAPLTTAQAPNLESLELRGRLPSYKPGNAITLFDGAPAPPPLQHLSLIRIHVAVEPLKLSGLVSLNLSGLPTISTPQLLEILRGSPGLVTLSLYDNPGLVAIESQAANLQPIELTKLVSLSIGWMDNSGTECILSNTRFPNCRHVYIGADIKGVSARSVLFTPSITHILQKAVPASDVHSSVIRVQESTPLDFTIKFRDLQLVLGVDGEGRIHEVLGWFADGLGSEAETFPVHLTLNLPVASSVYLAEVPPPFAIKHLSISDASCISSWESLFTAMARAPNSTSSGWLLPQLESLSVELNREESLGQLVSMLRSRYEGTTSPGGIGSRCPMNLLSVELRGPQREKESVEEISGILGPVNVFWGER